jgi:Tle cognate immunity protein 4 C-terminal domain/Tle cognate immunity protein 4 N-terminal domain
MTAFTLARWPLATCAVLAAVALSGCQPTIADMPPDEQRRMAPILAKLTPRCVGRYLIDLPHDFVLNPVSKTLIEGVTINIQPMKRHEFDTALELRQVQIKNGTFPTPYLTEVRPVPNAEGAIFNRATGGSSASGRTWELLAWREGFQLSLSIEARDESLAIRRIPGLETNLEEKFSHLLSVFERTRGRADLDIPTEPGVCFANGFVRGAPNDKEDLIVNYDMGGLPKGQEDGGFTIQSIADMGPQRTTLLQRGPEIEANLSRVGGATLRSGLRSGQGLAFDEWLLRRPNDRKVMMYDFTLELNSKEGNALAPLLIVDFSSGMGIARPKESLDEAASRKPLEKAIFNEAESIAIWDAVTPTLRKRPDAF